MPARTLPTPTFRPITARLPALVLAAALAAACSKTETPPAAGGPAGGPPQAMPVTVLEVQPTRVPGAIEVMGQTEGAREAEVRARVGGILVKRLYQEGTPVKAGQPLFQIDRAPYEIALADAKAKADQASREMARLKTLVAQQAISQKEYDDATSTFAITQAALKQAELNLSWTTVTAPVGGVSGRAVKSEGSLVTVGSDSLLTSVFQTHPIRARFSLAESEIARLPGGRLDPKSVASVALVGADGKPLTAKGRLDFVASTVDPTLGTRQLRAEFDNSEGNLMPGQFVKVRLEAGSRDNVFLVPQGAVLQTDQGTLVMLAGPENKVTPRPVQAGEWRGKDWVILGGLQPGDKVIVDNLMKLRPGAAVAPKPPQAPGAAPAAAPAPAPAK